MIINDNKGTIIVDADVYNASNGAFISVSGAEIRYLYKDSDIRKTGTGEVQALNLVRDILIDNMHDDEKLFKSYRITVKVESHDAEGGEA